MAGKWITAYVTEAEYRQVLDLAKRHRVTPAIVLGAFVPVCINLAESKPDAWRKLVYEGLSHVKRTEGV